MISRCHIGSRLGLLLLINLALVVTGCGDTARPQDTPTPRPIKIGYVVGTDSIPIIIAKEKGYFDEQGLSVELVPLARQRAQILSFVASGEVDGANATKIDVIAAISRGLPLVIVFTVFTPDPPPVFTLVARADSGISEIGSVVGKQAGLNRGGVLEFLFDLILRQHDIDPESISVLELQRTESITAFRAGQIDMLLADMVVLDELKAEVPMIELATSSEVVPNTAFGSLVFSQSFVENRRPELERFLAAICQAAEFINANPEETNDILLDAVDWQSASLPKYAVAPLEDMDVYEPLLGWLREKGYLAREIGARDVTLEPEMH